MSYSLNAEDFFFILFDNKVKDLSFFLSFFLSFLPSYSNIFEYGNNKKKISLTGIFIYSFLVTIGRVAFPQVAY